MAVLTNHSRQCPFAWQLPDSPRQLMADRNQIINICEDYAKTGRIANFKVYNSSNMEINPFRTQFTFDLLFHLGTRDLNNISFDDKYYRTINDFSPFKCNPKFLQLNANKIITENMLPEKLNNLLRNMNIPGLNNIRIASYQGRHVNVADYGGKMYMLMVEKDHSYKGCGFLKIGDGGYKIYLIPRDHLEKADNRKLNIKISNYLNIRACIGGVTYTTPRDKNIVNALRKNSYGCGKNAIFLLPSNIAATPDKLGNHTFSSVADLEHILNSCGFLTPIIPCANLKMFFADEVDLIPQAWWNFTKDIPAVVYLSKNMVRLHRTLNQYKDKNLSKLDKTIAYRQSVLIPRMLVIDDDMTDNNTIEQLHIEIIDDPTPSQPRTPQVNQRCSQSNVGGGGSSYSGQTRPQMNQQPRINPQPRPTQTQQRQQRVQQPRPRINQQPQPRPQPRPQFNTQQRRSSNGGQNRIGTIH